MSTGLTGLLTPEIATSLAVPEYRVEGRLKVTGGARYSADVHVPGTLWAKFLVSPLPHARIVSVDTTAAQAVPGVRAVLTGKDVKGAYLGRRLLDWPVLAWERVRFIGDRVAAVAADTRAAAEEAIQRIRVEYEELPAVFDPPTALAAGAPILHDPVEAESYPFVGGKRPARPHPNLQGFLHARKGNVDLEAEFARSARIFQHTFKTPRHHHGYIEPHATVVWIESDGRVRVQSTNKSPFNLRQQLALCSGRRPEDFIITSRFIGGDFGGKGLSLDEFACYFLARATGRPVRAVMTYVDELQAANPRHAATIELRTGVDAEGRFIAHHTRILFNGGAYGVGKPGAELTPTGGFATMAAYDVPNTFFELDTVYTNTVPCGNMRAPGEVQALFAGESHVDIIARELGKDPFELRLLNAVRPGGTGPANERFREPRAVEVLERLREEMPPERPGPNRGWGIAVGVRHIGGGKTSVRYSLLPDGRIEVLTGVPDQGAGAYTLIRRVAAAVLSIDPERITVTHGDTATAPLDPGAGASRGTHVVGQAARLGATALKDKLLDLAAEVMGWPLGEVRLEDDRFLMAHDGLQEEASFVEVAGRIARGATLEVDGVYDEVPHGHDDPGDFNFFAYGAEVEVDRETGAVMVRNVTLVADVGTVINPVAHQGQIDGGFVYGLGGALMEDLEVQDGKVTTLSLGEYKLPTQKDTPPFRSVLLSTDVGPGPFGAKMAGEVSNTGVAPALANAVADAVGARITDLPLTAERIYGAVHGNGHRP